MVLLEEKWIIWHLHNSHRHALQALAIMCMFARLKALGSKHAGRDESSIPERIVQYDTLLGSKTVINPYLLYNSAL